MLARHPTVAAMTEVGLDRRIATPVALQSTVKAQPITHTVASVMQLLVVDRTPLCGVGGTLDEEYRVVQSQVEMPGIGLPPSAAARPINGSEFGMVRAKAGGLVSTRALTPELRGWSR